MTVVDVIVLAWLLAWCVIGLARGMTEQLLSLGGLAAGAVVGGRLTPELLDGRVASEWVPVAALAGAVLGALLVQGLVLQLARPLVAAARTGPVAPLDHAGGALVGLALGLALAWLVAAAAVYQGGHRAGSELREGVQRSAILSRTLAAVPPDRLLAALERLDPLPLVPVSPGSLPPPDPSVLATPAAAAARDSVVQLRGTACGVGISGSGWVVADDLVVTNAHVVAGVSRPDVLAPGGDRLQGVPVYVDRVDDVALVRVPGLDAPALPLGDGPEEATAVVLLGYPGGGALQAEAGTAAPARTVITETIDGSTRPRHVVAVRGGLGPGSSGGPVVDRSGTVRAMIFGMRPGDEDATAAVPPSEIADALAADLRPVDTGACA